MISKSISDYETARTKLEDMKDIILIKESKIKTVNKHNKRLLSNWSLIHNKPVDNAEMEDLVRELAAFLG
jgi:hypothetical protein